LLNKKENNSQTLKWIYKRTKKFLPSVLLLSVISALDALTFVALALISKNVLDVATGSGTGSITGHGMLLFGVIFAQIVLTAAQSLLNSYTNARLTISMRNYLFSLVCRKKYSYISAYHSGDLLNRFTSDTDVIVNSVVSIIPNISSMAAKIIGGISALIVLDARIAFIILVLGISVPALGRMINRKYKALHKKSQQTEGRTRSFLQECFENIVVMKTFVSEAPFTKKLNQLMKENYHIKMKRTGVSVATHISLYSFFTVGYYTILIWGAGMISSGFITYGTLMAFLQLVSQLRAPLQNVSGIMPQYYSALASAERLMEIEKGQDDMAPVSADKLEKIKKSFSGLEVKDITFAYKNELILKNCSFEAEKGKITAITGESGSGKSTIFKIILGLYEPQNGDITVNGNIPLDTSLRGLFAYVPQGNMVLSGTIRENITLCNESVSREDLIKAAKAAEIYELISSMPEGFDTVISERGGGLSEGQIQRISIARALLTDAPVLLLDEATSALDEATETKVLSNIKALNGKTVLFVTHRNTSLKVCDKIIRVEDKKFGVIKE
ncbi:MAG: ABC transporter ATP-binding protein, partial [Acutalibacteraceae bacterium]|nr:ABC transporter ATP-binding protein [Acutalibacteraceae bacterium]